MMFNLFAKAELVSWRFQFGGLFHEPDCSGFNYLKLEVNGRNIQIKAYLNVAWNKKSSLVVKKHCHSEKFKSFSFFFTPPIIPIPSNLLFFRWWCLHCVLEGDDFFS